jgi:predicted  nucleic acid-binding Zn-ribbon protein
MTARQQIRDFEAHILTLTRQHIVLETQLSKLQSELELLASLPQFPEVIARRKVLRRTIPKVNETLTLIEAEVTKAQDKIDQLQEQN